MKRKGILFSVLSVLCVSLVAGCGEEKHQINVKPVSNEYGAVSGEGKYAIGATVNMNIYSNMGCSPSVISFTNKVGETIDIESYVSVEDGKYHTYQFKVSEETIGDYVVMYICDTKPANSDAITGKYKITYKVDLNGDGEYIATGDETTNEIIEKEVAGGTQLQGLEIKYIGDKKIAWKNSSGNAMSFDGVVNSDIELFGEIVTQSEIVVVKEAVETFLNSELIQVRHTVSNATAAIKNLNDNDKIIFSYFRDTDFKAYLDKPKNSAERYYYEDRDSGKFTGKMKLSTSAYTLDNLKDTYLKEFIDLGDMNAVTVVTKSDGEYVYVIGSVEYRLTIYQGKITGFSRTEEGVTNAYEVKYEGVAEAPMSNDVLDMKTVKLFSNDADLNTKLIEYNSIDKVLKMLSSNKNTLDEELVLHDIMKELKPYAYKLVTYNGGECTNTAVGEISKHSEVCVKVLGKVSDITKAYEALSSGDYSINTTVETKLGSTGAHWYADSSTDVTASDFIEPADGMNEVVFTSLEKIKMLKNIDNYYKVEFDDDSKEWRFYLTEDSKIAEMKITLNEEGKLETVKYTEEFGGNLATYVSEFTYYNGILKLIDDLKNGGYSVNSVEVGSDVYGSLDLNGDMPDESEEAALVWMFFRDLNRKWLDFNYDTKTKTFTKDNLKYVFTVEEVGEVDVVTKVVYTETTGGAVGSERTIEYTLTRVSE